MGLVSTVRLYLTRPPAFDAPTDLYAHEIGLLDGGTLDLNTFRGRPTLIVNTASKCGLTPQFEGLQALYDEFHERGLQLLGCPSGDFAEQELDEAGQIGEFCRSNYGVTFPMSEKMSVRADPHPLWENLARQPRSGPPSWNFGKYLVGADGKLLARFSSQAKPDSPRLRAAIEATLT
jgi:glutathione peroxidase-family protein